MDDITLRKPFHGIQQYLRNNECYRRHFLHRAALYIQFWNSAMMEVEIIEKEYFVMQRFYWDDKRIDSFHGGISLAEVGRLITFLGRA